jgi:hypothetical protein
MAMQRYKNRNEEVTIDESKLPLYAETALKRVRDLKLKYKDDFEHMTYLTYIEDYLVKQRTRYGLSSTYYEPRVHTLKDDQLMKETNALPYRFAGLREYLKYLEV